MKNKEYYETSDLALAAALQLVYEPIWEINKTNRKAVFKFRKTKDLDKHLDNYWRQTMRVDPLGYFNELKNIKARLYEK